VERQPKQKSVTRRTKQIDGGSDRSWGGMGGLRI